MTVPLLGRMGADTLFRSASGTVTADQFTAMAVRLAALLPPGTHVVNLCRDRLRFTLLFAAALLRRQVSLLCADGTDAHLRRLAGRFGDAYAVADGPGCASPLRQFAFPDLSGAEPVTHVPAIPDDRAAALVFTSGSTGEPVAHGKCWRQLAARSIAAGRQFSLDGATVVGTVPPQHMYGFETTVLLPLHARTTTWCGETFFPADIAAALQACPAPRLLVTAPLHLRALLEANVPVPPGTQVVSATAPLSRELAAEAERRWRGEVHEIFGATETGSIASRRTVAGDLWRPYPGVDIGLDTVRAPYAEETELSDLVELAPGGFRLLGRRSDLVKVGGRRASLAGLTAALLRLPGVEDAAMVPPREGELRMTAFVVAPGRQPHDLLTALRREIDPVFLPRPLVCVDRLPRNAVGKLTQAGLQSLRDTAPAA